MGLCWGFIGCSSIFARRVAATAAGQQVNTKGSGIQRKAEAKAAKARTGTDRYREAENTLKKQGYSEPT